MGLYDIFKLILRSTDKDYSPSFVQCRILEYLGGASLLFFSDILDQLKNKTGSRELTHDQVREAFGRTVSIMVCTDDARKRSVKIGFGLLVKADLSVYGDVSFLKIYKIINRYAINYIRDDVRRRLLENEHFVDLRDETSFKIALCNAVWDAADAVLVDKNLKQYKYPAVSAVPMLMLKIMNHQLPRPQTHSAITHPQH